MNHLFLPPQSHQRGLQIFSHQNINDPMDRIEKMKSVWSLLLLLLLLPSCTKEHVDTSEISNGINLLVSDAQGNDLLDPASKAPNAINLSKIKVYLIRDGKEVLYFRENMDAARGFLLIKPQLGHSYYALSLGLDCESKEDITTTIIDWGNGRRDVFQAEFYRQSKPTLQILQQKIWLNGELIWDNNRDGGKAPTYTITQ